MSSLPLSIWKCPVPCFWSILHWEEGLPWQRKVVPTQWLVVHGWALDLWEPAPFYGTSRQNTQYCGGVMKFFFRWTTKQVLKSLGSSKHTAKILPPEQVCPFFYVTLNILTFHQNLAEGWKYLSDQYQWIKCLHVGQIGPGEEWLWREERCHDTHNCREMSVTACAPLVPRNPASGHSWIRNLAAVVICSWSYLIHFHVFPRKIVGTSVLPVTQKTFRWFPEKQFCSSLLVRCFLRSILKAKHEQFQISKYFSSHFTWSQWQKLPECAFDLWWW